MVSKEFTQTKEIFDSLNDREQYWLGKYYIDEPGLLYRKVIYDGNKPIAFVQAHQEKALSDYYGENYGKPGRDDSACATIAVRKEYRGKGLASKLVSDLKKWFDQSKYNHLEWGTNYDNIDSQKLAEKFGFILKKEDKWNKDYEISKANMNESMGLAAMNPMVGMAGPHTGSFIVNVMNHDKDLGPNPRTYTGLARSLNTDDNLYGIDPMGRVCAKKKYEVMEQPDIISDSVEIYKIHSPKAEKITQGIIREAMMPYDQRPVHSKSYLYEAFTGKRCLVENQFALDPIFEKVELEKMSAGLNGVVAGNDRMMNMQHKGNKKSDYIPDNDYPSGTEHLRDEGYVLEGFSEDSFNDLAILEEIAKIKVDL